MKIWDKLRKALYEVCDVMEVFMAVAVVVGIVIATIALYPGLMEFWEHREEAGAFLEFLDLVFGVVIGIEFMKMLCRPNTANIIEALIFLIARHMIIQTTTAEQDLLSVISIGILFVFRRFMLATRPDKGDHIPNFFRAIKIAQSPEFREAMILMQEEESAEKKEKEADNDDFRTE